MHAVRLGCRYDAFFGYLITPFQVHILYSVWNETGRLS